MATKKLSGKKRNTLGKRFRDTALELKVLALGLKRAQAEKKKDPD